MKKALIVGCNYPDTNYPLNGCVNDAKSIDRMIRAHFGFTQVDLLLDKEATATNIVGQLLVLVTRAQPGDTILFYYSGHGSQILDTPEDNDYEVDGLDEILVPYDIDWKGKVIRDDDLKYLFDKLPVGVNLTVCLDCCNSGGGLDQINQYQSEVPTDEINDNLVGRYLPPPPEAVKVDESDIGFKPRYIQSKNVNQTGILLSGCRSYQTSADAWIDGDYRGAFSYALEQVLQKHHYKIDHVQLIDEINQFMVDRKFTQRPELNGPQSLFPFNFLEERVYENAVLTEVTTIQPEIKPKNNNKALIIIGIVAVIIIGLSFLN